MTTPERTPIQDPVETEAGWGNKRGANSAELRVLSDGVKAEDLERIMAGSYEVDRERDLTENRLQDTGGEG